MKFAAVIALAFAATVSAETCDVTSLASLAATDEYTGCQTDSGYTLTSLTVPDAATVTKMCESESCMKLLEDIVSLNIGDCTIGTLAVMSDLVDPIKATCQGSTGSGSTSTDATVTAESSTSGSSDATVTTEPSTSSSSTASSGSSAASTTGSVDAGSSGSNSATSAAATGFAATALVAAVAAML